MKPAVGHVKWLVAALAIRRSHCQRYARPLHVTTKSWSDRELRPHQAKLEVHPTIVNRELVTEFEYRPRDGVLILWHVTVSGYHDIDDING